MTPYGSLPLSRHQLFHTSDVDEARERVAQVFCPHALAPSHHETHLDARHHSVKLGQNISLNYVQYGPGVHIEPGYLGHFYLLQIPLQGRALIQAGAQQVVAQGAMASLPSPSEKLSMTWHADSPHLIVQMSRQTLLQHWEQLAQSAMGTQPLVFELGVSLARAEMQPLLQFVHYLYHVCDEPAGLTHPLLLEQAQQYLMSSLLLLQPHCYSAQLSLGSTRAVQMPRAVSRAKDFLHAHAHMPVSLADVCQHVCVSARTLQMAFRQHLGKSPMAYLRDVRLDRVRQRLLSADAHATTSVTQVALDNGFMHMGHFAAYYLGRFGERPHETLKLAECVMQVAPQPT